MSDELKITSHELIKYLEYTKWIKTGHWQKKINYYSHPDYPQTITVAIDSSNSKYNQHINDALRTLADIEQRPINDIVVDIHIIRDTEQQVENTQLNADEKTALLTKVLVEEKIIDSPEYRDEKGRFTGLSQVRKGKKFMSGVSLGAIRRHREFINEHVPEFLSMLMTHARKKHDIELMKWIVSRILPDPKPTTFANAQLVNNIESLTELKYQSQQTIVDTLTGETSIEEGTALMGMYSGHKGLIEAADIEPLAEALRKQQEIAR